MPQKKLARSARIDRIGRRLARLADQRRFRGGVTRKPLAWKEVTPKLRKLIAYDFETTRIKEGTPSPLYLTAFGEGFSISQAVKNLDDVATVLETSFLTDDKKGTRYVAWNANRFDAFFVGAALLHRPGYVLRPYLTRSKNLRGMRVTRKDTRTSWEFLDGMSMTGMDTKHTGLSSKEKMGTSLDEFLALFAPAYRKLKAPDWSKQDFDPANSDHVAYAERDSEGLWHAMQEVNRIVFETFGVPLQPTLGNTAIKIFQRNMPRGVNVWEPGPYSLAAIRDYVMRGGYCVCMKRYKGPIWKYDLNQAYAAAMRETKLPGGRLLHFAQPDGAKWPAANTINMEQCGIYKVRAEKADNRIPFYYRADPKQTDFAFKEIRETWLTSIECAQLIAEGWTMQVSEAYIWEDSFTMQEYVNRLEALRMSAPDGPNGALGTCIKSIGNSSYGKTVERLEGVELVLSVEQPDGFYMYQSEDDQLQHVWFRFREPQMRDYHQPQIGAFITAYVRMQVRRAALLDPDAFLYADTDCAIFSRAVSLPLDPKRYGMWKQETDGEIYYLIGKKIYSSESGKVRHAKGVSTKDLSAEDFRDWYEGRIPVRIQVQRQNFLKVMTGAEMFVERRKQGQTDAMFKRGVANAPT